MATVHLNEDVIDVVIDEIVNSGSIYTENLMVNIQEYSATTEIIPDTFLVSIEEPSLEVSIVEEKIELNFTDTIVFHQYEGTAGKVKIDFDYSDFNGAPMPLGLIPAGADIETTVVEIESAFDGDLQMTVGTVIAQANLMRLDENSPDVAGRYAIHNNLEINGTAMFYLFFISSGLVTTGSGRLTIYYH